MSEYSPSEENRFTNIQDWLEWGESRYSDLISRASETAASSGWDDAPRVRPCECRLDWRHGNLCMVCDNTRFRACAKDDPRAVDLYALGVSAVKGGFTAKSAGDESAAQKRAANIQLMSSAIASLDLTRRQREGLEPELDAPLRQFLALDSAPRTYKRIMAAVEQLKQAESDIARLLPKRVAIIALSRMVAGKIDPCRIGQGG